VNRLFRKVSQKILNEVIGKLTYQPLFEYLHKISISGMNYGIGGGIHDSGEIYVLQHIERYLKEGKSVTIFDVGAHTGEYTSIILDLFKEIDFTIYAFEPSLNTFDKLVESIRNEIKVKAYNFGLGSEEKDSEYYICEANPYLNSIYKRKLENHGFSMEKAGKIEVKTIDRFCKQNLVNHITLLKIDVEGHELDVLKGARSLLNSEQIDFIQLEFGGCHIDSRTYFRDIFYYLNDHYRIYRVLRDGLRLLDDYDESHEIFMTANFLAQARWIDENETRTSI
jgi:FkbM family methyltransferase